MSCTCARACTLMTHTPFVSNPCPATAIVFVFQNLFYGQLPQSLLFVLYLCNYIDAGRGKSAYRTQIFHRVNTFSIQNPTILEKTTEIGRNSNWRFAVKNKEIKQIFFSRKKNKKWIIVALVLVLTLGGGSVAAVVILHRNSNRSEFSMPGNMTGLTFTEDMIAASGVTNVGITEETFDVENLTTELEIEEVYAVSGEEVTAGDKILKLTEDSVEEARKELERALEDAELAYRTGAIEYEQNLITAEYTRDSAILTGQQAKDVYDETVASLQSAVTRAEEELQDAEDDIAEYESYVNDGSYKSYFKVDEYQAIYDENLKALTDKMDEWGVGWSQITGGSAGSVQALKLFRELNDMGNTIVMITHDLGVAQSAKRIVRIVDGQLHE